VTEAAQARARVRDHPGRARERLTFLRQKNRLLEAQRLEQRTIFDMEMLRDSASATASRTTPASNRASTGRGPADPDRLPAQGRADHHRREPRRGAQIRGMYYATARAKRRSSEYGFRMPSAFDKPAADVDEFTRRTGQRSTLGDTSA